MVTAIQNPFCLSEAETKAQARLQKQHQGLLQSRDELIAQRTAAQKDLDRAREQYDAACVNVAAGKLANAEAASAEIRRCEANIAGLAALINAKQAELEACAGTLNVLNQKVAAQAAFAERVRLDQNIGAAQEKVKAIEGQLEEARREYRKALGERAEHGQQHPGLESFTHPSRATIV